MANKEPIGIYIAKIKLLQERIFGNLLVENGIEVFNSAQSRILFILWLEDNITISELSKRTGLAKTTLTSMLDRLEHQGQLKRVMSTDDRRSIRIILTEKAQSLKDQYETARDTMKKINFKGFSQDEIEDFEDKLIKILNNLSEYADNNI